MSVKLALRRTDTPTLFGRLFNIATRWRLHTDYPHSGIVIDGSLYHATFSDGLHQSTFNADGWDVFEVEAEPSYVRALFNARKGAKYDAISLLAFIIPWRVRDSHRVYCYEWCWMAITGENPSFRVTPEMLLSQLLKMKDANGIVGG